MILLGFFLLVVPVEGTRESISAYLEIIQNYPDSSIAADAYKKIIDIYIYMEEGEVDSVIAIVDRIKALKETSPLIYKESYSYGLVSLFDYYQRRGEEGKAEECAKILTSEFGTVEESPPRPEPIEYLKAMRDTTVDDIPDLKYHIANLRRDNPGSLWLADALFLLSYIHTKDKSYDEALGVLSELKNWSDSAVVKERMSEIIFRLGIVYLMQLRYQDAITSFEDWISNYVKGEDARPDLAPYAYYYLASTYTKLADSDTNSDTRTEKYRKAYEDYKKVYESYPGSNCAARAAMRIIDFNIRAKQIKEAVEFTEEVKASLSKNREIYKNAYAYGTLSLLEYYFSLSQEENPPCEHIFKSINVENYYKLGKADFENGYYEDARDILSKLKTLKECKEVGFIMPETLFILAKSYYNLGNYNEAITELDEWLEYDEDIKHRNSDLLPEVHYYLALSYLNSPEGFCKALEIFRIIKNCYLDSNFCKTKDISADIELKIAECEKACKRPDK